MIDSDNLKKMLANVPGIGEKLKNLEEQIKEIEVTGSAGAGAVSAKVRGDKIVLSISIDDDLIKSQNKVVIQDLSVAAVNDALEKVQKEIESKQGEMMSSFGAPNIGDIMNMMSSFKKR